MLLLKTMVEFDDCRNPAGGKSPRWTSDGGHCKRGQAVAITSELPTAGRLALVPIELHAPIAIDDVTLAGESPEIHSSVD